MACRTWTSENDRDLAKRYVAGEDLDSIALAFGKTRQSVATRISTLGLLRRKTRRSDTAHNGNAAWLCRGAS